MHESKRRAVSAGKCGIFFCAVLFFGYGLCFISHNLFRLQVSFVNGIATIRGGTHVDHVANQIATHVMEAVNKKNKNAKMKMHTAKGHLWVFVNALIDNPAFDSQTKETLTTRPVSFGSTCDLSPDFLKKGM